MLNRQTKQTNNYKQLNTCFATSILSHIWMGVEHLFPSHAATLSWPDLPLHSLVIACMYQLFSSPLQFESELQKVKIERMRSSRALEEYIEAFERKRTQDFKVCVQWKLSIVDTTGPRRCVLIREVSEVDLYTYHWDLRNRPD